MLVHISTTDTLTNLSAPNGQLANSIVYAIFGILTCVFLLFLLIRKKPAKSENDILDKLNISSTKIHLPKEERKQEKKVKQDSIKSKETEGSIDKKIEALIPDSAPKQEIVKPEKEEQSKEKYIGYDPINIFAQTEPFNFPYVIMPKPNCVIKFPRKGRVGRKGYKEEAFKVHIEKYFKTSFQVFDDRFILIKNSPKPFEPDFTLVDEKNSINIFLDIEIDEPYEGLNDIGSRRATHFQYSDTNRNNAFKNRGWIMIRFAEIQVHQEPDSCCRFVADVIKSIYPSFTIPTTLINSKPIQPIKQWTKEEAEAWSKEKYREKYLKIPEFGTTADNQTLGEIVETELGEKIEKKIKEEEPFIPPTVQRPTNTKIDFINTALQSNKHLSFKYQDASTVIKPIRIQDNMLIAFCYVKNTERTFNIYEISNLILKSRYYTEHIDRSAGLERVTTAIKISINYNKYIRMKYIRGTWTNIETGEFKDAEESLRTISNIGIVTKVLEEEHIDQYNLHDDLHINAFCNRDNVRKTFRFDRIEEIKILDI